jgi:hypothetical protein
VLVFDRFDCAGGVALARHALDVLPALHRLRSICQARGGG